MGSTIIFPNNCAILLCLFLLFLTSCARAPIERVEQAMRLTTNVPILREVTPLSDLVANIANEIEFLRANARVQRFRFGERVVEREDYLHSLEFIIELTRSASDYPSLWNKIKENFDFYEVYGREDWGQVFITSYYEPVIMGRRKKQGRFTQALYRIPEDLLEVKIRQFGEEFEKAPPVIRGRLAKSALATANDSPSIVPYYSRAEIDGGRSLERRGLELFWVDPVDSFFLQIQGSGVVEFPNGESIRVGYAAQNGHAYEALGKYLKQVIPLEEMSQDRIEDYLRSLRPENLQTVLNQNPSYVFFKPTSVNAVTYLGTSAVGLRTIATDAKFFPKGALALLEFQRPIFMDDKGSNVQSWETVVQMVIDQDVGGAIKGADRVDLFWGRGSEAKRNAGIIKQKGRLFYLAPKVELIETLRGRES